MWFILLTLLPLYSLAVTQIDNDIAQPIVTYNNVSLIIPKCVVEGKPLDLIIVLDVSGSLKSEFENSVQVVREVLGSVAVSRDTTRVALVAYSRTPYTLFHLNSYDNRYHILHALNRLRPDNTLTYTGKALEYVQQELSPQFGLRGPQVPKIVFLISDGKNFDRPNDEKFAKILRDDFLVPIWAFGTGNHVDTGQLVKLTDDPHKLVTKKTLHKLENLFSEWKGTEICDEIPVCLPGASKPLDLIFVVDSSSSLNSTVMGKSFTGQVTFMHRVLNMVNVHHEVVKVALISFASKAHLNFDFNRFSHGPDVHEFIDRQLVSFNGTTQTKDALLLALETFEIQFGSREGIPKMLILLTDGHASKDPKDIAKQLAAKNITVVAVGVGPERFVDQQELLTITNNRPEMVFYRENLHTFEKFMLQYVDLACPGRNVTSNAATIQQPITSTCSAKGFEISVRTAKPFQGVIHVMGYGSDPECYINGNGRTTTKLILQDGKCGVTKIPDKEKTGYSYKAQVRIQFHPQVVTNIDQSRELSCFYISYVPVFAARMTDKSLNCNYTLHQFSPSSCTALSGEIGQVLYHKWDCGLAKNSFTKFLVHDCIAEYDGQSVKLLDQDGCQVDPVLMETPNYDQEFVYRQIRVFAFPETTNIRYKCFISTCDMDGVEKCKYMIPPPCKNNGRSKRAIYQRVKSGFLNTFQVQTRSLNVIDKAKTKIMGHKYCYGVR